MSAGPSAKDPVALLQALIRFRSVTPAKGPIFDWLEAELKGLGFRVERPVFSADGLPDVENLLATIGAGAPHLVFAGHVDVVPSGPADLWSKDPFGGAVADGFVHGRGAVDMKGGIAGFMAAVARYLEEQPNRRGSISFLITGDEEGPSVNGTAKLLAFAKERGLRFDAALVGEPTSRERLGDQIKIGRRGSLSGVIRATGKQGHAAYPELAANPVSGLAALVARLAAAPMDDGTGDFQPTEIVFTSFDTGNETTNVIPPVAAARFNIRFNDRWDPDTIEAYLRAVAGEVAPPGVSFHVEIVPPVSPVFLTGPSPLVEALAAAIADMTGGAPERSTGGGTSDARFIKDFCPVVEFGSVGKTMHGVDERVSVAELQALAGIYRRFLERYFGAAG